MRSSFFLPCHAFKSANDIELSTSNYSEVNLLKEFLVRMGQEDKSGKFPETLLLQQSYLYNISS